MLCPSIIIRRTFTTTAAKTNSRILSKSAAVHFSNHSRTSVIDARTTKNYSNPQEEATKSPNNNMPSRVVVVSELILVRHGDRFDYSMGEAEWRKQAAQLGHPPNDPPLSALGHEQARDTGEELWKLCHFRPGRSCSSDDDREAVMEKDRVSMLSRLVRKAMVEDDSKVLQPPPLEEGERNQEDDGFWVDCTRVLVSPYMRVIQTAGPLADRFMANNNDKASDGGRCIDGVLCIEPLLSEVRHVPGLLATPKERWPYFPQVDVEYKALTADDDGDDTKGTFVFDLSENHKHIPGSPACESYPRGYMERCGILARKIDENLLNPHRRGNKTRRLVCFSHAASVALVGHLLKLKDLSLVGKFAPCGMFRLVKISIVDDDKDDTGNTPTTTVDENENDECREVHHTRVFPSLEEVLAQSIFDKHDAETIIRNATNRWLLVRKGETNQPYVTNNSPATYPWTFPSQHLHLWQQEIGANYNEYADPQK